MAATSLTQSPHSERRLAVSLKEGLHTSPADVQPLMPNIPASRKAVIGRPCLTCQRRKIKCDREKPSCQRCQKAKLQCDGYSAESFVLVVPTRSSGEGSTKVKLKPSRNVDNENSKSSKKMEKKNGTDVDQVLQVSLKPDIDVTPENRMQVLSYFLDRFIPSSMTSHRNFVTPSSWLREIPNLLGRWEVLDTAVSAVCLAYIGDIHHDRVHIQSSQLLYNDVLRKLSSLPLDSLKSSNDGVLTTTMIMAMYELFHTTSKGLQGWMVHIKGACQLLELRGPPSSEVSFDLRLYTRIRITALWDAYGSRKMLFLARQEWQNLSNTPHDTLLDSLVCMPGLLESTDNINLASKSGKLDIPAIDNLLGCWHALHLRLSQWLVHSEAQESFGVFDSGPLFPNSHPYLDANELHLHSMFPQVISFKDAYITQIALLYWFGQLVIHTAMLQLYTTREMCQIRINPDAFPADYKGIHKLSKENVKHAGDYYATKICQSIASLKGGYGFQMVLVPLWAAQQFFDLCDDPRYEWCQTVMKNFGADSGFVLAEALRILSPTQYPGFNKGRQSIGL